MKILKLLLFTIILGVFSHSGFFLDNGIGIKGMQVGGAYTANPEGGEALYWNVANLISIKESEFYFSYAQKYEDLTDYSFIYSIPSGEGSAIGVAYYKSGVDNIIQRDTATSNTSTFQFIDDAIFLGYAQKLPFGHSYGVSLKLISQKAVDEASYMSLDLGYKFILGMFDFGLVAQDVFVSEESTEIKPRYRAGLSTQVLGFTLSTDYMHSMLLEKGFLMYGVIYDGLPIVSIKAGYNEYDKNLYAGLSVNLFSLKLDYLYSNPDLGVVHQFGMGVNF